jgi:peptide/nickel transport system substrate-binding protein
MILLACLLAIATVAVLAVGCEGDETAAVGGGEETTTTVANVPRSVLEGPQGPPSADAPQYGGTLVLLHNRVPTNIGAFFMKTGFADVQQCRYALEALTGLDSKGDPVPQLATSWDVDDVAKTITFHLREGVTFHDGTAFDAEAAKWNLEMYRNGEKKDLQDVISVEVVDPLTIKLTMSKIDVNFIQSLSSSSAGKMISPTAYETLGEEGIKLHPVGTGPFEFESYEPNVALKYKKFDGYWQEGLPYLDGVEIRYVADGVAALTAYKAGEAQALYDVAVTDAAELEGLGHTVSTRVMTIWGIAGDMTSSNFPYSKLEVRQGLSYALDRETAVLGVYEGFNLPTDQLAGENMQAWNSAITGYPYDPIKAKELLAKNGITPETPWKVTMTYITGALEDDLWAMFQEDLREVGIELTLNGTDYAGWQQKAMNGAKNELVNFAFSYNGIEMQYSTSLVGNLSPDRAWYPDLVLSDAFDTAYEAVMAATTREDRELAYQALNKIIIDDDCCVVPFLVLRNRVAKSPDVHDYGFAELTTAEFLPEMAWLSGAANPPTTVGGALTTVSGN